MQICHSRPHEICKPEKGCLGSCDKIWEHLTQQPRQMNTSHWWDQARTTVLQVGTHTRMIRSKNRYGPATCYFFCNKSPQERQQPRQHVGVIKIGHPRTLKEEATISHVLWNDPQPGRPPTWSGSNWSDCDNEIIVITLQNSISSTEKPVWDSLPASAAEAALSYPSRENGLKQPVYISEKTVEI